VTGDRWVIDARGTSGAHPRKRRTVRVVRYATGEEVHLGVGDAEGKRPARAAALLTSEGARRLAAALLSAAERAETAARERAQ
jgi:hypothetical protein